MNTQLAVPVRDGRDAAGTARIFRNKSDEVAGNETAVQAAKLEAQELEQDIQQVEKQIKALTKIGDVPERLVHKLNGLRFRLQTAKDASVTQLRISNSRRENLEAWLGEGSPSNRELIEIDRLQSAIALRSA